MIDLSIVVVSFETRALLLECLESLERALGDSPLAHETVVVDNGSGDGSAAAVTAACPWAEVLPLPHNLGFARGANAGLARTRGRHVLLLNSDTRVPVGALERAVAHLDAHPQVGLLGAQLLHPDGRLQNSIHAPPGVWTELLPTALLQWAWPARFPSKRRPPAQPVAVESVLGAALFVRRAVLDRVGGLPEDYFFFLEETDWCWEIRAAGWEVWHAPDVRIEHVSGASSKRRDPRLTRIEYHRSLYRFVRKRRGRAAAALVVVIRCVKLVGGLGLLTLAAPFSGRIRSRWRERAGVLVWHLGGCPSGVGLGRLGGPAEPRRPVGDAEGVGPL
ncbi:MAG: glycosyltransferase family 2 protein [Proteobacteria bacterium]|nr:glycosyltransferase family 2 protein [Pseudomonadota bacterium]